MTEIATLGESLDTRVKEASLDGDTLQESVMAECGDDMIRAAGEGG